MGTLCVLTELTFRVFPRPTRSAIFGMRVVDPYEGFALLRKVWSSPLDATGLAYTQGSILVRIEGEKYPLEEKCAMLRMLLGNRDLIQFDEEDPQMGDIGNGAGFAEALCDVWRLALPPAKAADVVTAIGPNLWYGDWAGALLWVGLPPGDIARVETLRALAEAAGGHATLLRADEATRKRVAVFPPEEPSRATLTRAVKAAFDPLALFNHGRMVEGI